MPTGETSLIETGVGEIWGEPGIVCVRITHERLTVPMLKALIDFVREAEAFEPVPVLLDLGVLECIDKDAREFASAILTPRWNKEIACVCHNPVQRVIASFFRGLNKIMVPIAITVSIEDAVAWLRRIESGEEGPAAGEPAGDPLEKVMDAICAMAAGDFGRLLEHRRRAEDELVALNDRLIAIISERERIADELQMINTELEGFAHTVTHDLKAPLAAIGAASHMLLHLMELPQTPDVKSDTREVLEILLRNVDEADVLVEDTLELAEAGQAPNILCTVEVSGIVDRVLEERALDIVTRQVKTMVDDNLGAVFANPTQIYQVFSNVIGNAITHNDSPAPVVEVRRLDNGGHEAKRYVVKDNGSGIAPDQFGNIFKPFRKGPGGATGVGLSIVSRILEVYGGDIVASNDGGARFDITLRDFEHAEPLRTGLV